MIPAFDNVKEAWSLHLGADALKQIQRTKRITRALHKEDRSLQGAEDFISKPCSITGPAQRISKANQGVHLFFQGNVAPDTATHAFADENYRGGDFLKRVGERQTVRRDQFSQGIGPPSTLTHVRIIESYHISDC
jgi:type II secretory pathway component PulJ